MISKRLVIRSILGAGLLLGLLWSINIPLATAQATAQVSGILVTKDNDTAFESATIHADPIVTSTGKTGKVTGELSGSRQRFPLSKSYAPLANRTTNAGGTANGDFESGPDGSWTESSSHMWPIIVNSSDLIPVLPHSGDWAAWLGGGDNEAADIRQSVAISAESSILTYWNLIDSEDSCGHDWAWVAVNGNTVISYTLCSNTNTADWVKRSVDLRAYMGQTVQLQFQIATNDLYYSSFYIDDVALGQTHLVFLPLCTKK